MKRATTRTRAERGQATTEFVVLGLVLVPLFIIVPLIGRYMDMMQATEAASRYVAFEATTRNTSNSFKSDADLATEVRRRFYSNTDAPVKTGDVAGDFAANRNPLWVDHAGRPLLPNFDTGVGTRGTATELDAVPAMLVYRDALKLPNGNFYTGSVTVNIADVAGFEPFDKIGLHTTRTTVLLADAWTGTDPGAIRSKIEDSVFTYPIGTLATVLDVVGVLPPLAHDPRLKVGAFDWDMVPCDRLVGGC